MGLGDFFNRYEETNNIGFMPLFPEDYKDEYYTRTINQIVASGKSIDSSLICASLLGVNQKISFAGLDRLGGSSTSTATIRALDKDGALSAVQSIDPSAVNVTDTELGGAGGLFGLLDYVIYSNTLTYGIGYVCGVPSTPELPSHIYWNIDGLFVHMHHITIKGSGNTISWTIVYQLVDGTIGPTKTGSMNSSAKFWGIWYDSSASVDCSGTPSVERVVYIDEQYLSVEDIDDVGIMTVKYKVAGVINNDKYLKAINARMGLPNRELKKNCDDPELTDEEREECLDYKTSKELLEDKDLHSQILTYAVYYEEPYIDLIDQLIASGIYQINVEGVDGGPSTTITYQRAFGPSGKYEDFATGMMCQIDGAGVLLNPDEDEIKAGATKKRLRYIIPVEYIQKHINMRDKYNTIENGLCWLIHNQKITKKKWYQTGFFRILTWIVAIALTAYGNPSMLIGLVGSTIVTGVFGSKAGMVLGIITAIYTLGSSLLSNTYTFTMNTLSMVADLTSKIYSLYFSYQTDNIIDDIKDINDKSKATQEAIDEMQKEALYIPFSDVVDNMFHSMYELLYNEAYSMLYNYDRMTSVNHLQNLNKGIR